MAGVTRLEDLVVAGHRTPAAATAADAATAAARNEVTSPIYRTRSIIDLD